jgi:hypothetical protein
MITVMMFYLTFEQMWLVSNFAGMRIHIQNSAPLEVIDAKFRLLYRWLSRYSYLNLTFHCITCLHLLLQHKYVNQSTGEAFQRC